MYTETLAQAHSTSSSIFSTQLFQLHKDNWNTYNPMYILFHMHWSVCVFMLGLRLSRRSCWIFKSSGMWCCFADISKDHTAFIFRVKQSRTIKLDDTAIRSLNPSDTSQTAWTFVYPCFIKAYYISVSHCSPCGQWQLHCHNAHNLPSLLLNP